MKLGVFLTTHLHEGYRHGGVMESTLFDSYLNNVIKPYITYKSDINTTIYICDTGSNDVKYINWVKNELPNNVIKIDIPNHGGAWAAMKYLMHNNFNMIDEFDYLLFSVDHQAGVPQSENWEIDLINKYTEREDTGIMGRFLDSIKFGPNGLVDHRNCAPHFAKIWNIKENIIIPHLHGNWYFINKKIFKLLAEIWYNPIYSIESMEYQKKYENIDFCILADMKDNRKTLDDIHIGREVELPLRLNKLGYKCLSYKGTSIYPNAIEPFLHWKNPKVPVKGFYGEYIYENN